MRHLALTCEEIGLIPFPDDIHYLSFVWLSRIRYHSGGFKNIINTDLSDVVIKQQASKFPNQTWKVMDALNLEYDDKHFPVIIDKSLIDTLLCASQR